MTSITDLFYSLQRTLVPKDDNTALAMFRHIWNDAGTKNLTTVLAELGGEREPSYNGSDVADFGVSVIRPTQVTGVRYSAQLALQQATGEGTVTVNLGVATFTFDIMACWKDITGRFSNILGAFDALPTITADTPSDVYAAQNNAGTLTWYQNVGGSWTAVTDNILYDDDSVGATIYGSSKVTNPEDGGSYAIPYAVNGLSGKYNVRIYETSYPSAASIKRTVMALSVPGVTISAGSGNNIIITNNLIDSAFGQLTYTDSTGAVTGLTSSGTSVTINTLDSDAVALLAEDNYIFILNDMIDLQDEEVTVSEKSRVMFLHGGVVNGWLNWTTDEYRLSQFGDLRTALSHMIKYEHPLDGEGSTIDVTDYPVVIGPEYNGVDCWYFNIRNFVFESSNTVDYSGNNIHGYPTQKDPGLLGQCGIYFSGTITYSKISNCRFKGPQMFGVVWYTPHNSPVIEDCIFEDLDCALFCYGGSQNYHIVGCTAYYVGCFFASSAACFDAMHPAYDADSPSSSYFYDNYYTDGLVISRSTKETNLWLPAKNADFDEWFRACILKPETPTISANNVNKYFGLNTYESWKGSLDEDIVNSMLDSILQTGSDVPTKAEHDLDITGHAIYIPFRNYRRCYTPTIEFDIRLSPRTTVPVNDVIRIGGNDIYQGKIGCIYEYTASDTYHFLSISRATKTVMDRVDDVVYDYNSIIDSNINMAAGYNSLLNANNATLLSKKRFAEYGTSRRIDLYGHTGMWAIDTDTDTLEQAAPAPNGILLHYDNTINGDNCWLMNPAGVTRISYPGTQGTNSQMIYTVLDLSSAFHVEEAAEIGDTEIKVYSDFQINCTPAFPDIPGAKWCEETSAYHYTIHLEKPLTTAYAASTTLYVSNVKPRILYMDYRCYSNVSADYYGPTYYLNFYSIFGNKDVAIEGQIIRDADYPESVLTTALRLSLVSQFNEGFKCYDVTDGNHYILQGGEWLVNSLDSVPTVGTSSATGDVVATLKSNTFTDFGEVDSLSLTLAEKSSTYNEWIFQFTASASFTALTLSPAVTWAGGNSTVTAGKTYQVRVLNGLAQKTEF